MSVFDVRDIVAEPRKTLAATTSRRQRTMLRNFMLHGLLEVAGRWQEILAPELMVDEPHYRIFESGAQHVLDGVEQVGSFYAQLTGAGLNVFGSLGETVFVSDWGLALESLMGSHLTGEQAIAVGLPDADPDGYYQLTRYISSFWPYTEDCRLIGEHIYENSGSRRFERVPPSRFVSPGMARGQLADLIEECSDWRCDLE